MKIKIAAIGVGLAAALAVTALIPVSDSASLSCSDKTTTDLVLKIMVEQEGAEPLFPMNYRALTSIRTRSKEGGLTCAGDLQLSFGKVAVQTGLSNGLSEQAILIQPIVYTVENTDNGGIYVTVTDTGEIRQVP